MKKLDNFANSLNVLKKADFEFAFENEIDELMLLICDSFIAAFDALEAVLREKSKLGDR